MLKKLVASLALAALALAPIAPAAAQVNLNLNGPVPTIDTTNTPIDPATKQGQATQLTAQQAIQAANGVPTDPYTLTYDGTAASQISLLKGEVYLLRSLLANYVAPGTIAPASNTVTTVLPQITPTAGSAISFGTTAATLLPALPTRHFMTIQVQGAPDTTGTNGCWINGIAGATADANSLFIARGGYFESATHVGTGVISIICSATLAVYSRQG